jgi:hypothetical protein
MPGFDLESPPVMVFRDTAYQRLCATARAAHRNDIRLIPAPALDWEFAAAVSKLNRHPMAWLLDWAGVKIRKPWWDKWLLLFAALLFIAILVVPIVLAGDEPWSSARCG